MDVKTREGDRDKRFHALSKWRTSDVILWLRTTGIGRGDNGRELVARFQEEKLQGPDLLTLTQRDLIRVLKIVSTPLRLELWKCILELRETTDSLEANSLEEQDAKELLSISTISSDKKKGLQIHKSDLQLVRAVTEDHLHAMLSRETCSACLDESSSMFMLACGHCQCRTCLTTFFRTAIKDISVMPPKCCKIELDTKIVQELLTEAEAKTFRQRLFEVSTKRFTYCPAQNCASFISLDPIITLRIRKILCPRRGCGTVICVKCRGIWSGRSHTCTQQTRETARVARKLKARYGYQNCPECKEMIELKVGCNHIKCFRCKTDFCYLCGVKWKNCGCPLWIESNLYEEGKHRVEAERRLGLLNIHDHKSPPAKITTPHPRNSRKSNAVPTPFSSLVSDSKATSSKSAAFPEILKNRKLPKSRSLADAVRDTVSRLRNRDHFACNHIWQRVERGHYTCPHCGFYMWVYHMFCFRCETRVCYTCARHRL